MLVELVPQRNSVGGEFTATHFFVKKKFGCAGKRQVPRPICERIDIGKSLRQAQTLSTW